MVKTNIHRYLDLLNDSIMEVKNEILMVTN